MSSPRLSIRRIEWYGPEKRCPKCNEWWPEDAEFFYPRSATRFDSWCRACINERRQQARGKA